MEMAQTSYLQTLLLEGRSRRLRELADLARDKEAAERLLADIHQLNEQLGVSEDSPSGLDYRDHEDMWRAITDYLQHVGRPATQQELARELVRGMFRGYRTGERDMDIRVGRCIRAYALGKAKENPKLKQIGKLVGLADWPDSKFEG